MTGSGSRGSGLSDEDVPPDPFLLLEIARGLIGLHHPSRILRHVLLSLLGSCGARSAIFLGRDRRGRIVLRDARGLEGEEVQPFVLSQAAERALVRSAGPLTRPEIARLGGALSSLAGSLEIQCLAPVVAEQRLLGMVALGPKLLGEPFSAAERSLVREVAEMARAALWPDDGTRSAETGARPGGRALDLLRRRHPALDAIRGDGEATCALCDEIVALSEFDLPVLIIGETGTGKELVARALHDVSPRAARPFEAINCASIPRDLMASALFGHERGAFTGAVSAVRGAFERAGEGTIFLDEIGDMPLETQASLLRVLQEHSFRRLGSEQVLPARARVISATNRDLTSDAAAGRFRHDLFYRIQMYSIRIQPLRDRRDEIPALVEHILRTRGPSRGTRPTASPAFLRSLHEHPLQGNVRELEGLVLGAVVRARGDRVLRPEHLPKEPAPRDPTAAELAGAAASDGRSVAAARETRPRGATDVPEAGSGGTSEAPEASPRAPTTGTWPGGATEAGSAPPLPSYTEMEREYIRSVLRQTGGNKKQAAAIMGIPRTTLNARIGKLGLEE